MSDKILIDEKESKNHFNKLLNFWDSQKKSSEIKNEVLPIITPKNESQHKPEYSKRKLISTLTPASTPYGPQTGKKIVTKSPSYDSNSYKNFQESKFFRPGTKTGQGNNNPSNKLPPKMLSSDTISQYDKKKIFKHDEINQKPEILLKSTSATSISGQPNDLVLETPISGISNNPFTCQMIRKKIPQRNLIATFIDNNSPIASKNQKYDNNRQNVIQEITDIKKTNSKFSENPFVNQMVFKRIPKNVNMNVDTSTMSTNNLNESKIINEQSVFINENRMRIERPIIESNQTSTIQSKDETPKSTINKSFSLLKSRSLMRSNLIEDNTQNYSKINVPIKTNQINITPNSINDNQTTRNVRGFSVLQSKFPFGAKKHSHESTNNEESASQKLFNIKYLNETPKIESNSSYSFLNTNFSNRDTVHNLHKKIQNVSDNKMEEETMQTTSTIISESKPELRKRNEIKIRPNSFTQNPFSENMISKKIPPKEDNKMEEETMQTTSTIISESKPELRKRNEIKIRPNSFTQNPFSENMISKKIPPKEEKKIKEISDEDKFKLEWYDSVKLKSRGASYSDIIKSKQDKKYNNESSTINNTAQPSQTDLIPEVNPTSSKNETLKTGRNRSFSLLNSRFPFRKTSTSNLNDDTNKIKNVVNTELLNEFNTVTQKESPSDDEA